MSTRPSAAPNPLTSPLPDASPTPQLTKDTFQVVLKMAELKVTTKGERAARAKPVASMSLRLSDLVAIKACDVGMSDLAVGPSRTAGDLFTDAGISRGERFERELVAWAPTGDDHGLSDAGGLLEDPAMRSNKNGKGGWGGSGQSGAGGWDQFAANKSKFNVDTTFDENLYTTSIDKNAVGISEAEADRIAREIMSQGSTNVHVQEERGLRVTADYDEEDRYGAVIGTGAAAGGAHSAKPAVPKAPAWGGSGAGVTAITGKAAPPPKPHSPPPPPKAKDTDEKKPATADGEKPKSTLNPNAKAFTLSAKAAEFKPSFLTKKPAAPAAPAIPPAPGAYPIGMPGMMPGMMPQYPMGMPGIPPNMMPHMPAYGAPQYRGAPPQQFQGGRGGRGGRGGQQMGGFSPQQQAAMAAAAAHAAHAAASAGVPPPPAAPAPPPAESA